MEDGEGEEAIRDLLSYDGEGGRAREGETDLPRCEREL